MTKSIFEEFEPVMNGHFMLHWGPEKHVSESERSHLKLCLTATDCELLAEVLLELSEHPKCRAVKFSVHPKDGMHLGRVFINDEQEVGRLWQELKRHPRLMCSIQDDAFTTQFRTP